MARGGQVTDSSLGSPRFEAARAPSAPTLQRARAGKAARLAGCGLAAAAGTTGAATAARRSSRGGGSSGGGGCTGGGGRGSITHLHTHRGRSLDSPKPRHGAGTLSSPDLAGARPALPRHPDPPLSKSAGGSSRRAGDLGLETGPRGSCRDAGGGLSGSGCRIWEGDPSLNPRPLPALGVTVWNDKRAHKLLRGWGSTLLPGARGPYPGALLRPPSTIANFGGLEHPWCPPCRARGARKEKAVTFVIPATPRAGTQAGQVCRSAVPGCWARCTPSRFTSSGSWIP